MGRMAPSSYSLTCKTRGESEEYTCRQPRGQIIISPTSEHIGYNNPQPNLPSHARAYLPDQPVAHRANRSPKNVASQFIWSPHSPHFLNVLNIINGHDLTNSTSIPKIEFNITPILSTFLFSIFFYFQYAH